MGKPGKRYVVHRAATEHTEFLSQDTELKQNLKNCEGNSEGWMTRVTREGKRAKHSFTITPSTSPEHSDPSVVTTGHSDICHQIRGDCRPWHSPLLKALSHHLFPKGKWDWRMAAYTGKNRFQSHQKAAETDESRDNSSGQRCSAQNVCNLKQYCQPSVTATLYSCADFPSGLTRWDEKKLRNGPHD